MLTATPIREIISRQRQFLAAGKTKEVNFRREQLQKLKAAIKKSARAILDALYADLYKPEFEGYFELAVTQDIDYALKHINPGSNPKKSKPL